MSAIPWEKWQQITLNALRIMTGFLFLTHGGQKLFGWFGAEQARTSPIEFLIAGILEFFGGLAIALGLGTRWISFVVAGEMAVAYFWRHFGFGERGFWPWENRGELPALYCFIFLFLWASGGGNWTLERVLRRKTEPAP